MTTRPHTAEPTGFALLFLVLLPALLLTAEWLRYPEDNTLSFLAASVAQFIGGL